MYNIDYLLEENARLREEVNDLQDMNHALSHILQYAIASLGSIRVPRQFGNPNGKIEFHPAPKNTVDVLFIQKDRYASQTGDPTLDAIFRR